MTLPYPPPWQDLATLAEHICAGESTIERWVKEGIFPAPRKVGGKNLWSWKQVEKHLARSDELTASSEDELERIRNAARRAISDE
jgi:predicted DNA-binding transcriptional regulator AlpA